MVADEVSIILGMPEVDNEVVIHKPHVSQVIKKLESEKDLQNLKNKLVHVHAAIKKTNPFRGSESLLHSEEYGTYKTQVLHKELQQIESSQTLDRARYYLRRLNKGLLHQKTSRFSDINLNRWKEYDDIITDSLWIINKRDSSGVHNAGYWGNFIPQIPNQLIKRYTKQGELVLDPFSGSGTTSIEAQRLGRNSIGIELQPRMATFAENIIVQEQNTYQTRNKILCGDSSTVCLQESLREMDAKQVQLIIMHPPYYDIIKFSDDSKDLSNASSLEGFITRFMDVFDNISPYLERKRFLALVIGDKYAQGEWLPLGFLVMNEVLKRSFLLKSIVVKNFEDTTAKRNQKELWNYRALLGGFYIFKHEYIFLFQKK